MTSEPVLLDNPQLPSLSRETLYRALGYPDRHRASAMKPLIEQLLQEGETYCRPAAGYRKVRLSFPDKQPSAILLEEECFTTGRKIRRGLKDSTSALVFLCTLGEGLDQRIGLLQEEGDPAAAFILDTLGSLWAEGLVDELHRHVQKQEAPRGVSQRYSPGYCGWDVQEQQTLFRLLPETFCGVELSPSSFMEPRKSVSGIIGTGPDVKILDYPCAECSNTHCLYKQSHVESC